MQAYSIFHQQKVKGFYFSLNKDRAEEVRCVYWKQTLKAKLLVKMSIKAPEVSKKLREMSTTDKYFQVKKN